MEQQRHIERGKVSTLHFGSSSSVRRPRPVRPGGRKAPRGGQGGESGRIAGAVLAVAAVAAIGFALYWTMWREVPITINGEAASVRVGTTVETLLGDNDYFSAKPGRLLSVGGNVISEDGGPRCTLAIDGEQIDLSKEGGRTLSEGTAIVVSDGADATEESSEQTVALAPGVQMESGGAIQYVAQWGSAGEKVVLTGAQSGEVVDKEVLAPAVDMVIASRNVRPKGDKKYIALTFDDGPSGYTPQILDILKDKGVHATFYNLGNQEERYGKTAKRVVDEGHELASHTNAHQYLPNLDNDALRAEITSAADAIEGASGTRPAMMRAPYGAFTASDWARAGDLIGCNVLWNIDTLDWKRPGAAAIARNVLDSAYNGAIVLMHDGGGDRSQDIEALPGIIDGLKKAGYELVTVSELMKLDGEFPQDVIDGTVKMPEGAVLPGA